MPRIEDATDEDLVLRMAAGDEKALATLYRRRCGAIHRFALLMGGSHAVADEVVQETFLAVIDRARSYDPSRGSVAAFLYGIARNRVRRWFERARTYEPLDEIAEGGSATLSAAFDDPLAGIARKEAIESLRRAVAALPPRYREVVALCDLDELSYLDAAAVLGCAVGTVRSRLHRAHALLVRKLGGEAPPAAAAATLRPTRCTP
jgi:RNA polymerase sigma-70 factor (ECF subfamily)